MKTYRREIFGGSIALLIAVLTVWFYFGTIEKEQTNTRVDLYELILPHPDGLLAVNRPGQLRKTIFRKQSVQDAFAECIPGIYLSILQQTPDMPRTLLAFYPQGIVMYAQSNGSLDFVIEKEVLKPLLGIYTPQSTTKYGITFTYYPEAGNRFFGFYQYGGTFVASSSKKLLEAAARQQLGSRKTELPEEINKARQLADRNAPLNLLIPADRLNLYVDINDSLQWRISDKWLLADIFGGEGNICLFGSQPYFASLDTLYAPMADTLAKRLEAMFLQLHITSEVKHDETMVYYTGCEYTIPD